MWTSIFRSALLAGLLGFGGCLNVGCAYNDQDKFDSVQSIQNLREAGFSGKARLFYDSAAHFGGFSYEPFGSAAGYIEIDIDPDVVSE